MVTPDELSPALDLAVTTRVNDELRQNGRTGEMLFSVAEIIEAVSARIPSPPETSSSPAHPPASAWRRPRISGPETPSKWPSRGLVTCATR
jgi:hypothetical protein